MMKSTTPAASQSPKPESQSERFMQAAPALGRHDDPDRFKKRLGKLVRHKPVQKPE
jgi:hypothetical protein